MAYRTFSDTEVLAEDQVQICPPVKSSSEVKRKKRKKRPHQHGPNCNHPHPSDEFCLVIDPKKHHAARNEHRHDGHSHDSHSHDSHSHDSHSHDSDSHDSHSHDSHSHDGHSHDGHSHEGHSHHHIHENHWLKATVGLLWGAGLLGISLLSFNIPLTAYIVITGLTSLMTLYLGHNVYRAAWQSLKAKEWDTTTLYALSTFTILLVSVFSLFVPGLPMMFEAAPLVLGFWHLGEGIEHTLIGEITKKLDVRDCAPKHVLRKGPPDIYVPIEQLVPGDVIIVPEGEVIPVDGILESEALLYTTRIDGSPELKEFSVGKTVRSGMTLADHVPSLKMRVTKTFQESYLSLIAKNIAQANDEKAPIELFANKILGYFIPGLLIVAAVSGVAIGVLFTPALAIQSVVAVLVSACPCALSLITPMAVRIGMQKAAEHGVHFNNGKALQAAADIDTVVFDLNGTLTQGALEVTNILVADLSILPRIALLQSQSEHPVAKVITSFLQKKGVSPNTSLTLSKVDKSNHSGIKGLINNERYMIGNIDLLISNGITSIPEPFDDPHNGSIYIVQGSAVVGQIAYTDPLRTDAIATIQQLKALGKKIHICTGADRVSAEEYAQVLGIPKEHISANNVGAEGNTSETSKIRYIQSLQQKGHKVAMVGDAANDVAAIAYADLGIAVKSSIGDKITEQHAGMIIQQGLLFPIATGFDIAQKSKSNIMQNLYISLAYNATTTLVAAGLFVGLGFALNPALGVLLVILESTIVLANLYRFKQQECVATPTAHTSSNSVELQNNCSTANTLSSLGNKMTHDVQQTEGEIPHFPNPFSCKKPTPGLCMSVQSKVTTSTLNPV